MYKTRSFTICCVTVIFSLISCKENLKKNETADGTKPTEKTGEEFLNTADFDTIVGGKQVRLYWIRNGTMNVAVTNYGGRVVGLWVPDKNGKKTDVVIGMSSTENYINSTERYFGATIGRVGNRIAKGKFSIDGENYQVPLNNGENSLHGGIKGFQDVVWEVKQHTDTTLTLEYVSRDMEEGFPGELRTKVTLSARKDNTLHFDYESITDKTTVVNLTNHAFFNLNGEGSGNILNHKLHINAELYTPVDSGLIPTGEQPSVKDTPFDFNEFHTIGERIENQNEQLEFGGGYDHNYVLKQSTTDEMVHAATAVGDQSGIVMKVYTTEPGLQFYSGNFMKSENVFKSGARDDYRTAFCLETQHFPDAPNQADFPSIVLEPGQMYRTTSEYSFDVEESKDTP